MNGQENQQLKNLYFKVGELSGRVNQMDKNIDVRFTGIEKRLDTVIENHESRINKVEEDCAQMKGKSAAIGGIAGFIVAIIGIIIAWLKKFGQ